MPFPIRQAVRGCIQPFRNVRESTYNPTGLDGMTGPSYGRARGNTPVRGLSGLVTDVRRWGVNPHNRQPR